MLSVASNTVFTTDMPGCFRFISTIKYTLGQYPCYETGCVHNMLGSWLIKQVKIKLTELPPWN